MAAAFTCSIVFLGLRFGIKFGRPDIFPECVARVSVSLWGSGGWGCVRSTLRLRPQPFATVRNRSQPSATVRNRSQPSARLLYGRAYGKFSRRGHFWRFQKSRCFFLRGRRGTSWHSDVFCNVSKVVLCGKRNTFATFSEDALQFTWQAQHFGRAHRHFAWQAHHFTRVVLRVFLQIALAGLRQVSCGILWDVMKNWQKPRTKHWFWGSKFRGS